MDRGRDCDHSSEIQCIDLESDSAEIADRATEATCTEDGNEQNCIQHQLPPPYSPPQQHQQPATQNTVPVQGTRHSSTNDTGSRSRSTQRNQLAHQRRSRPRDQSLISEPPPPYPGPPVNSSSSRFVPMAIGASSPNRATSTAPFPPVNVSQNQPVYILSSYGQVSGIVPLLPGQPQYSAVAETRSTAGRVSQSFPPVTAPVITQPRATAAEQTATAHVQGHPAADYAWFSFAMVALCALQCNILALICVLPALAFSMKAQQYNGMGRFQRAKSYGRYALLCNTLALLEYMLLIVCVSVLMTLAIVL